jgi:hypothetical protein
MLSVSVVHPALSRALPHLKTERIYTTTKPGKKKGTGRTVGSRQLARDNREPRRHEDTRRNTKVREVKRQQWGTMIEAL